MLSSFILLAILFLSPVFFARIFLFLNRKKAAASVPEIRLDGMETAASCQQIEQLRSAIDRSLETGDKELFLQLSSQYVQLLQSHREQVTNDSR